MALFKVSFGSAMGGGAPVVATIPREVETLTADGSTTAKAEWGEVVTIYTDVAVHVAIGQSPAAGTTTGYAQPAGVYSYGPCKVGDKVAIAAI